MGDEVKLTGLKIENGCVYNQTEKTGTTWVETPTELLPMIEALTRKLDSFQYVGVTRRENVIFENEKNIGTGIVKDYTDKDGDKHIEFQATGDKVVDINEDKGFGLDGFEPNTIKQPVNEVNYWGTIGNTNKKTNKHKDEEGLPDDTPIEFKFRKRRRTTRSDPIMVQRDSLMQMLLSQQQLPPENLVANKVDQPKKYISFMNGQAKSNKLGINGTLVVGVSRWNARTMKGDCKESRFYLNYD